MVENNSVKKENTGIQIKTAFDIFTKLVVVGVLLYCVVYFLNPSGVVKVDKNAYKKIDSINNLIQNLEQKQFILYNEIKTINHSIDTIDFRISNIKSEKIIIKEKYNEKIKAVDTYSDAELDSIFSNRYPRSH